MATQKQLEALRLWRVAEGKAATKDGPKPTRRQVEQAQIRFAESIAYGDLPTQLLPSLRRTLVQRFEETPRAWSRFARRMTVEGIDVDEKVEVYAFNQDNLDDQQKMGDGFVPGGLPSIGRQAPYPQIGLEGTEKTIRAGKVGEAFGIEWEAIVNTRGRRVNLVRDALEAFGRHAANTEDIRLAQKLVKSSGFATASGEGLNGATALSGNPDLYDPEDIATVIGTLLNTQVEGQLVPYSRFAILTSTANAPYIRRAVNARNMVRNPGATSGLSWSEQIDFGAEIEVIGWKWLSSIWSGIGKGAIIVPIPDEDELPVLTVNLLEGYETPSLWIKDSNARQVGGGEVNPEVDGDFDSDAVMTKVRHVVGASSLWNAAIGYTTGANA